MNNMSIQNSEVLQAGGCMKLCSALGRAMNACAARRMRRAENLPRRHGSVAVDSLTKQAATSSPSSTKKNGMTTDTIYFARRQPRSKTMTGLLKHLPRSTATLVMQVIPAVTTLATFGACMLAIVAVRFTVGVLFPSLTQRVEI